MGDHQASSKRMQESGRVCWQCRTSIDPVASPCGERLCKRCEQHPVDVLFTWIGDRWRCSFSTNGQFVSIIHFTDDAKIEEITANGHASMILEDKQARSNAISNKRGRFRIHLDADQLCRLRT